MKITSQKIKKSLGVFKVTSLILAGLLVLLPATGFGSVGVTAAQAEEVATEQDTSLSLFQANDQNVTDGQTIYLPQGSTDIAIAALPTNDFAEANTSLNAGNLQPGSNIVTVTVLAEDGITSQTYTLYVVVAAPSNVKTLSSVYVNGTLFEVAADGSSVYQAPIGTTQVAVEATPTAAAANADVTGNTNLVVGDGNVVTITVTAEDNSTANYTFKVNVAAPNANTDLSIFKINDASVIDDQIIDVAYGTTAVSVTAETAAATSTYTVSGNTGLNLGNNTVSVLVTAQSGATYTHSVTVRVAAPSSDRSIDSITVNGATLVGSSIDVAAGVTRADVVVDLHSNVANYTVSGNTGFVGGANYVTVTVTSQDGFSSDFVFTVNVYQPSTNTAVSSVKVGAVEYLTYLNSANSKVLLPYGTTSVTLNITAADTKSTYGVTGVTGLVTGDNSVVITVTSESGAQASYTLIVNVAKSSNAGVSSITVDGVDRTAVDSAVQVTGKVATSVAVAVVTADANATYEVLGATGLSVGLNTVTVRVTAADGTVVDYLRDVNVPGLSSNKSLAVLTVDGVAVSAGDSVAKPYGTGSVVVVADPADDLASAAVVGASGLVTGSNSVVVTVTAEDGSKATYAFTVVVAQSSNAGVSSITVDGVDRTAVDSAVQVTGKVATSVAVAVVTADANATYEVLGATGLSVGLNTVTVRVTAADGTVVDYLRDVNVPGLSSNKSLAVLTVDGVAVSAGDSVAKPYGTGSVVVVADPADDLASAAVVGASGLVTGSNSVVVTVTAEDGSKATYAFTVVVAQSSNAGVSSITVDGVDRTAVDSAVQVTGKVATSVAVAVVTADANATYEVLGATGLSVGLNTVTVRVTAADGTVVDYLRDVNVPGLSSNKSLAVLTVDGVAVSAGDSVAKPYGTGSVVVVADPADDLASAAVVGASGLVTGSNSVVVTVTAEDGSKATYAFTVVVAQSSNAGVSSITVNGTDVTVSKAYTALVGTTSVSVAAQTSDVNATYEVLGATNLQGGANSITVRVTAADGVTSIDYPFTVSVPVLSSNNALASLTVDGSALAVGGSISRSYGTASVEVVAEAEDSNADVLVTGDTGLVTGTNTVTVAITAENGAKASYTFTVVVAKSPNAGISSITINGVDRTANDESVQVVTKLATSVAVSAVTQDANATFEVLGNTGLNVGLNTVTVRVTAADGTVVDYFRQVSVPGLSTNKALNTITVDGSPVSVDGTVNKTHGVTTVSVVADPTDDYATYAVTGATGLKTGTNTVTVAVTAEDGSKASYTFTVEVARSSEVGVESISVGGSGVAVGGSVVVPFGTAFVDVVAVPVDLDASVAVLGASGLSVGLNTVTVRVTAADGVSSADYVVTVSVTAASTDSGLSLFTVNGVNVLDGSVVDVASDVSSVLVAVETSSDLASYTVSGASGLLVGENFVSVSVTAQDGSVQVYSAKVVKARPLSSDVSLASLTVNGSSVVEGAVVDVVYGTSSVDVVALASDVNASTQVFGVSGLVVGLNTVQVRVTAEDQSSRVYEFQVRVARSNNTGLLSVSVAGVALSLADLAVTVAPAVSSVEVSAVASDGDASVSVSGNTALSFGLNIVEVRVVAADGVASRVYQVAVTRTPYSSDARLGSLRVNGVVTAVGSTVSVEPGVSEVSVVASAVDADASVDVFGASGLVAGDNTVSVRVTAADGSTASYLFTVFVRPVSTDASLKLFTVNGEPVVDGGLVQLDGANDFVSVVAQANSVYAQSVVVSGSTGLQFGLNTVSVSVTAESGLVAVYQVGVFYPDVTDASLKLITVDGVEVADGDVVELQTGVTDVDVVAEATYGGEVTIEGGTDLQPGENSLVVSVTSLDGENTAEYTVTLNVAFSTDVTVESISVNGEDVADGGIVEVEPGTTEVEVVVTTTDPDATSEVVGNTDLVPGENEIVITVTAADGETTGEYTAIVLVRPSTDTSLAIFTVNDEDVVDGQVVQLEAKTTEVDVVAEATDPEATVEVVGGADLVVGDNELVVTVTAADGETTQDYAVTLVVAASTDTSLAVFTVNGSDVADGDVVELESGVTDVEVVVEATDPDALVEVVGDSELQVGENELLVTVTAADGETVASYAVTLVVAASTDTSLAVFTVNGSDVQDGDIVDLEPGTADVDVVAEATDPEATVEVVGGADLVVGDNELVVTVTAADGETTQDYAVTLVVAASTDTSLAVFTVNGSDVADGDVVELESGVTDVEVVVEATDPDALVEVVGDSELQVGENELLVTVTAADGETVASYAVTLVVAASTDTSLAVFTVNGSDVQDGDIVDLEPGTADVDVVAEATDPEATVEVVGGADLVVGDNELVVTVTAADGETTQDYAVTLVVAASTDTSLAVFTVNGSDVADGDVVELESGVTDVEVVVEATDPDALVEVVGDSELQVGENELLVTVTAADGETVASYAVTLVVAASTDTSLAVFTVNGSDVQDGDIVDLEPGTADVDVVAEATDPEATVEVVGGADLVVGDNELVVTVTAADGETTQDYAVTLVVAASTDTSLAVFTVNGSDVADGDVVELESGVTDVEVVVEATDPDALVEVVGDSELQVGENELLVTVTAADGETVASYAVTLVVAASTDTSLAVFTVNGSDVQDGDIVDLEPGTADVDVVAEATDPEATVEVVGGADLVVGDNELVVTVTAADGETTQDYAVTLVVAASTDTSLAVFTVNGSDVADGDVVELESGVTDVEVVVEATDPDALVEVVGDSELQVGENELLVTVTAADGETVASYAVTLVVAASTDTSLAVFTVNGSDVQDGDIVDLEPGTADVDVVAEATDPEATVEVVGGADLVVGDNELVVTVTAADGETTQDYAVTLVVAASTDTSLAVFTVNGSDVADGDVVELESGVTDVEVVVEATDPDALVEVVGDSELQVGENELLVTVTAADGETVASYAVTLVVAASTDTSLAVFTVNGSDVQDGDIVDLEPGTADVDVVAEATDPEATVEVVGGADLVVGDNELVVTVTAADGETTQDYAVTLVVAASTDTSLAVFTVNGSDVADGDVVELESGVTDVEVVVEATDPDALVEVVGDSELQVGENELLVTVTAADGETVASYAVTLVVAASTDTSLAVFTVNGSDVQDGDIVDLEPGTADVDVVAEATDPEATVEVVGGADLVVGDNELVVTVTAADGETTQDYAVTLVVAASTDTSLAVFTVNGSDVADGDVVELESGVTDVEVVVEATDPDALVEVVGDSELQVGENELLVTVTAADGETVASYAVTLVVAASTDTSLAVFTVNGSDVQDGDIVDLEPGTADVDVVAEATDPEATVEVVGGADLVVGDNELVVTVTAADGETTQDYAVTLVVAASTDTSLAVFTVNGSDVADGDVVELESGVTDVEVVVEATDPDALVEVVGDSELQVGENELLVTVTAADGETVASYAVTLVVAASTDTSLAVFTVNGSDVQDGDIVDLEPGTADVDVVAEATDPEATVEVVGGADLVVGDNELVVTVTAADGETTQDYAVTLVVAASTDTSLAVFTVNGSDVADGDVVELESGVTDVEVVVEATDPDALVEVVGDSELQVGENELLVTVTAADGETVASYAVTLVVAASTDTSLAVFTVNGSDVQDGDIVDLEPGTADVDVVAEATDPEATVEVVGGADLVVGDNELVVTVTAADGETTQDYAVTLVVAASTDTSLAVFTVNGSDVADGDVVELESGVTDVEVVVEATDPDALVEVVGDSELQVGENELLVTVTAADGETVASYAVTLVVAASTDTSLAVFTVNGSDVQDGDIVDLEPGTADVDVVAEATDPEATVEVVGGADLVVGDNELVVTVTAADGETTQDYAVTLVVAASTDTSLAVFTVNGSDVADGDVVELESGVTDVEVVVEATDPDALVEVVGDSELQVGENELLVTVTAADGETVASYAVTLVVAASTDTSLAVFTVNGSDVQDGDIVDLEPGTADVDVVAEATDPEATVEVVGGADLVVGDNELVVTVTAADGETTQDYAVTLVVAASTDTSLAVFTVNGSDVADGDVVELEPGIVEAEIVAEATDENATVEIQGGADLAVGDNELVVTVTAADGETTQTYTVTLVAKANNDVTLATFTVNGADVADGDSVELATGVTEVEVVAEATDPEATVEISGGSDLQPGDNELVVTVTAADGETTATYTVTLVVLLSAETGILSINVEGTEIQPGDIVTVAKDVTSVSVEVTAKDETAEVVVEGADALELGDNAITITVTAPNGDSETYEFTVRVGGASADTALTSLTLNGVEVTDGQIIELPARTTAVNVVAVPRDEAASIKVTGKTGLKVGTNLVEIEVTAPDQVAKKTYTLTVIVAPLSSNTNLSSFKVNGEDVIDGGTVQLPALTRQVTVDAITADPEATVAITGRTNLADGTNTLSVAVTAADGTVRTYLVTLNVRILSSDKSLSVFKINGSTVQNGDVVNVANGTQSVEVEAVANSEVATVEIVGGSALVTGDNFVSVLVRAENGSTQLYRVNVKVALSSVKTLSTFKVAGQDVADGTELVLPQYTKFVTVQVATTDANARFTIQGATGLVSGNNQLAVVVTAADGTQATYTVKLYVTPLSADTSLKAFKINGVDVVDQGTVTVPALTTSVSVVATTNDARSAAVVTGRTGLVDGNNIVSVTVTAQDGSVKTYQVTVRVLIRSSDTSLQSVSVNGSAYTGTPVNVAYGTPSVEVVAVPTSSVATVVVTGATGLRTGSNTVTIRVTAENQTFKLYTVTVVVAKSSNTALSTLTVNGFQPNANGPVVLPARTALASVKAVAVDPDATIAVSGTALVSGDNIVVVTVTAADGTVRVIQVPVYVTPLSSNANLSSFKVNGEDVVEGQAVNVPFGTVSVPVVATPADAEALVAVVGGSALRTGSNQVVVTVTAANGTKKTYQAVIQVAKSSNTALRSLTINGSVPPAQGAMVFPARTALASVKAVAVDPDATIAVSGTALVSGDNIVVVTVTAADGTVRVIQVPVYVTPLSSNANLSSFKVNGEDVVEGQAVNVPFGTVSVPVVATPADAEALVAVVGGSALRTGSNQVVVTVTAANGTKKTFQAVIQVAKSYNTRLSSLTVNGAVPSQTLPTVLPPRSTFVAIKAVTEDPEATVVVSGTTLVPGANLATVTVTAADGTVRVIQLSVFVTPLSSNANLDVFKVNGEDATDGATFNVPFGTTSVPIVATPADAEAQVFVSGGTALRTGNNPVFVTVTAANGTKKNFSVNVKVALSSNTNIKSLTINGLAVPQTGPLVLPTRTTLANVKVAAVDPDASVAITGTALVSGTNTVAITVTAPDLTARTYSIQVYVTPLSSNAKLSVYKVNGVDITTAGQIMDVAYGTTSVPVVATTEDAEALVSVTGGTALRTGLNPVVATVTAANGTQVKYAAVIRVAKSSNTALSTLTVGGRDILAGASVVLAPRTATVAVKAVTVDPDASVVVTGTSLVSGDNTVTVTITAADGTVRVVTVPVYVTPLSSNANLSTFKVNGEDIAADEQVVTVANGTTSVVVSATAQDSGALVAIAGGTGLRTGNNPVAVTVVAADGTKKVYTAVIRALKSSNTNLNSVAINGVAAVVGSTIQLPARTTQVTVKAVASDAEALVSVTGGTNLIAGTNSLKITVTAPSGAQAEYNYTLSVAALSNNANLGSLFVGTSDVLSSLVDGELATPIVLPVGASNIPFVAKPASNEATVAFAAGSALPTALRPGSNRIAVEVTAADGTTKKTFAVTVVVTQRSSNSSISTESGTWTINGTDVSNSATVIELPAGTTAVTAKAKTADAKATLAITGATGLVPGSNTVRFIVTAEDGVATTTYERTVTVRTVSSNTNLTSLVVAGKTVVSGGSVSVPAGTTRVEVIPTLESKEAKFTVTGNTGYLNGTTNTVTVTVTAPSGAVSIYTVSVVVAAPASDTSLSLFNVEGTLVSDGSVLNFAAGKTTLKVAAKAKDLTAAVSIVGKSGLVSGVNLLIVTVTAKSGASSVYTVTINVG